MPITEYAAFDALTPYFDLVQKAIGGLVDGEHFLDTLAEDVVFEVLYEFPGWPRAIRGRTDLIAQFAGYGNNIRLHAADKLVVHRTQDSRVVILEYEVHGTILAARVPYDNRFVSVITIKNRKIARWRDYMDSLAAWNALTAPLK
jgi:uncharacterized protein